MAAVSDRPDLSGVAKAYRRFSNVCAQPVKVAWCMNYSGQTALLGGVPLPVAILPDWENRDVFCSNHASFEEGSVQVLTVPAGQSVDGFIGSFAPNAPAATPTSTFAAFSSALLWTAWPQAYKCSASVTVEGMTLGACTQ